MTSKRHDEPIETSLGGVSAGDAAEMVDAALGNIAHAVLIGASDHRLRIILDEQMQPGPGFEVLLESGVGRLLTVFTRLTATALGRDPSDPELRARALALLGQVLVFRMARKAVLRTLGWEKIGPDEFAILEGAIRANTEAVMVYRANGAAAP